MQNSTDIRYSDVIECLSVKDDAPGGLACTNQTDIISTVFTVLICSSWNQSFLCSRVGKLLERVHHSSSSSSSSSSSLTVLRVFYRGQMTSAGRVKHDVGVS